MFIVIVYDLRRIGIIGRRMHPHGVDYMVSAFQVMFFYSILEIVCAFVIYDHVQCSIQVSLACGFQYRDLYQGSYGRTGDELSSGYSCVI